MAYYRVSTARQGRSGLGLDAQRQAVAAYIAATSGTITDEMIEIESGSANDRPQFTEALRLCRITGSTLIIAKLDRLARNVAFVSNLMEAGIDFLAVDFPQANRLTVHILAAVAEHERRMISDRTIAALVAAKARGIKLGGDRGNLPSVAMQGAEASAKARCTLADKRATDVAPLIRSLRNTGHSFRQISTMLAKRGIQSPRGVNWSAAQISRTLARGEP
ncbi:MAG: recombinase family protein [Pseudomonadota bacterium]